MNPPDTAPQDWRLARRIAFRFACAYWVLYLFPFPLEVLPGTKWLTEAYEKLWQAIVPWVGKHVLRLSADITVFPNGSGDTTFNYVQVLCYLVLATVAVLVWSLLDRRRTRYTKAHDALRVYVRYALAVTMISYGLAKVFKTQFPFPGPDRLLRTYGDSSPMGLLWSFMGYSLSYNIFTGAAETLGGVLLFFRRTTTLGALVVTGVMANVAMLNFSYDVPVKLLSTHLLVMALFLLLPDLRRLANLLVLNRPTEPVVLRTPFELRWQERTSRAVKYALVAWILFSGVQSELEIRAKYGEDAPRNPFYGLYEVEAFSRNGEPLPPLSTDAMRWRVLAINHRGGVSVQRMNDVTERFRLEEDAEKKTVTFNPGREAGPNSSKLVFTWSRPEAETLVLDGTVQSDVYSIRLKRVDESKFLLVNRGFNWINEYPFHR
jgi:uncharacterized membrane protein YphA (DoxX/SURF4 family)